MGRQSVSCGAMEVELSEVEWVTRVDDRWKWRQNGLRIKYSTMRWFVQKRGAAVQAKKESFCMGGVASTRMEERRREPVRTRRDGAQRHVAPAHETRKVPKVSRRRAWR